MQFALFAAVALAAVDATLVNRERGCGPQSQVCTASYTDAASNPQWECVPAVEGEQVSMVASQSETTMSAKVCGPGDFHFSPMQCAGDKFEYKKITSGVDKESTTTGCQIVSFPYKMACYKVNC